MQKLIVLLSTLLLLVACQPTATSGPTPSPAATSPSSPATTPAAAETPTKPAAAGDASPHFLLSSAGPVTLLRDGWDDYHPTAFGAMLAATDLLNVDDEARVLCVANDLAVKTISGGEQRVPCPQGTGILVYKGAEFTGRRMGVAGISGIPFVLYPRSTLLLADRPTFYWNDTGAGSYSVMLTQGGRDVWSGPKTTSDNTLPYPADEPALEQDKSYRVRVIDDDSQISSRKDEPPGTGFALASDEEIAQIEADAAQITTLDDLTAEERDFALGVYYAGLPLSPRGFSPLGEAWLLLERLQAANPTPPVLLLYGDVLGRLSLPDLADLAYQQAIDTATALGDLESQAAGNARLWCSKADDTYYQEAARLYRDLGDQQQLEALPKEATEC